MRGRVRVMGGCAASKWWPSESRVRDLNEKHGGGGAWKIGEDDFRVLILEFWGLWRHWLMF